MGAKCWNRLCRAIGAECSASMFRGDAAFANPEIYELLEAEGMGYAIRLPANRVLQEKIGHLLKRPVGRPPHEVRRYYSSFRYRAGSWNKPRRVVAKVEWRPGELCPRVGFIVTSLARPAERVVAFYNHRGTCEQYIKAGKGALKWTRLSCRSFVANAVRLQCPRWPTTYGPPRLQAVIARVSDQSAPTYPVSRTKPRPRWRSARPGSYNLVGVKRHVGHQISKPPFYCQAISSHHPQTSLITCAGSARPLDFPGYRAIAAIATASRASKVCPVRNIAQAIRASLFASATTTVFTRSARLQPGASFLANYQGRIRPRREARLTYIIVCATQRD